MSLASAVDATQVLTTAGLSIVEAIFTTLVGGLNLIVPDSKNFVKVSERSLENFYTGTGEFKDKAEAGAKAWSSFAQSQYRHRLALRKSRFSAPPFSRPLEHGSRAAPRSVQPFFR